ncbi:MAG: thiolase family protein [Deltaproteobacteria bacterium]|nr:MAG: thiolase family protein [Deltaproteobacteria bacterium]
MKDVVIVEAVRTPFSPFGGPLRDVPSIELGACVIKEIVKRSGLQGNQIDEIFYGMTMMVEAALYNNVCARQAALLAGLPPEQVSLTIDRACCSSMTSAILAFRTIGSREGDVMMAVGAENMSHSPQIAPPELRWGQRMGPIVFRDPVSPLGHPNFPPEAKNAGDVAVQYGIGREEQDAWAYQSQMRYQEAKKAGKFKIGEELTPVEVPQRKGPPLIFNEDAFPKPETTLEKLGKLRTIYDSPTVTPGNAPGLDTGASALLIMSGEKAREFNLKPLAKILATASVCTEPTMLAVNPGYATKKVLSKAGLTVEKIDLFEINEAFAAVPLVSSKILGDEDETKTKKIRERLNVNGGAIAIGHPVGASGARIIMTLMYELNRRGGGYGVAAICGGLSQGDAVLIKVG